MATRKRKVKKVSNLELDTKGMRCPLPVLRARKALKGLESGQVLSVVATDPDSQQDFAAFCETTGHELLSSVAEEGVFRFEIRKTGA
ncbi:MAG: sulfurtransferase TusA family protein [Pseudomonadota bacterium]